MRIAFDPKKDATNRRERGLSLGDFGAMDFSTAISAIDEGHSTATETRWTFVGYIGAVLHVGIVTFRDGVTRVISLRHASRKERREYAKATK